jgi:hypothetical protein
MLQQLNNEVAYLKRLKIWDYEIWNLKKWEYEVIFQ